MKTLVLGSDHGALELKAQLKTHLEARDDVRVVDLGTYSEESVDYPDIANTVVQDVLANDNTLGILCCGTGIGISIRANRFKGIRAALVHNDFSAQMAKEHNNANILCLGGRTTAVQDACRYVDIWLDTGYEGGRHQRRVDKLDA